MKDYLQSEGEGDLEGRAEALDDLERPKEKSPSLAEGEQDCLGTKLLSLIEECPLRLEEDKQELSHVPEPSQPVVDNKEGPSAPSDLGVLEETPPSLWAPVHPEEECSLELLSAYTLKHFF